MNRSREEMLALAERCEAAAADEQHELLVDAFEALTANFVATPSAVLFLRFLGVGAFLDAAMTLVPEGWYWQVGQGNHAWASVYENPIPPATRVDPIAATPALALCAATLRQTTDANDSRGGVGDVGGG